MTPLDLVLRTPGIPAASRISIAPGGLARLGRQLRTDRIRRAVVVSEPRVAALYGLATVGSLRRAGIDATLVCVPHGERAKSPRELARLWDAFAAMELGREDAVVALGGGVVGDLAGFAASTWLRGVPWIGVPTSLLAQVDSSVGGKTGVDLAAGKNLAGAFHAPRRVLVDPDLLGTLPARHLRAGLAEVVKLAVALDAPLFRWLERRASLLLARDSGALTEAITRSIRGKARIVRADEREREGGRRTALNLGHTLGHALESTLGYRGLLHGEAVAVGLRVAMRLSVDAARLDPRDAARVAALLDDLGLRHRIPGLRVGDLMRAMRVDKKRRNGKIRWVLTPRLGHASVPRLIPGRRVQAALEDAGARR